METYAGRGQQVLPLRTPQKIETKPEAQEQNPQQKR